jgi:F-type H+/Na+-transporting ATPase subunit alpha
MELRAEEISQIIKEQITDYDKKVELSETGVVLSVGDGIARVYGLEKVMAWSWSNSRRDFGPGAQPGRGQRGYRHYGRRHPHQRRRHRQAHRQDRPGAGRRTVLGRVVDAMGNPHRRQRGRSMPKSSAAWRWWRPALSQRKSVHEPCYTGLKGRRRHDAGGPRPARVDHRRPPDRQDRLRHRCHHRPERFRYLLHLCGLRAEKSTVAQVHAVLEKHGAMEYTTIVSATRQRPGHPAVHRALRRNAPWANTSATTANTPDHLRRFVQAGRRLPAGFAAAAPSARTRSLSRRHFLQPLPPAGAILQAQR